MGEYDRLVGGAVELQRMLRVEVHAWRQNDAFLSRAREYMAAFILAAIKPIGVVEGTTAQSQDIWKSLQFEADSRRASATEVEGDAFPTGIGAMMVKLWEHPLEQNILFPEDRLDQIG
jgi:hypothetical protein